MGEYLELVDWLGFDPCPPGYDEDEYIEALGFEIDATRDLEREGLRIKPARAKRVARLERIMSKAVGPIPDNWLEDDEGW